MSEDIQNNIPQEENNTPIESAQIPQELEIVQRLVEQSKQEQSQTAEETAIDNYDAESDDDDDSTDDNDKVEGFKSAFKSADSVDDDEEETEARAPQAKKYAFDQPVSEILAGLRPATPSCCGTSSVRGGKLHVYDWLEDLPEPPGASDLVEVQFKNTRKSYYRNQSGVQLHKGDIVAVESSPGHDIGVVTLSGRLVYLQMHKYHINPATYEFKRVYRIARPTDIEKWEEAKSLEQATMLESRQIAERLNLNMKIGDVEYQGDRTKAIFYYIADERVDFRELIKVLADRFHVRIEMKQIGARQEAGRIGGIGPCGRELCCASWMTNFVSVTTHSARVQDLSLNPLKLAGQCGKLKCCLNYELDVYLDAIQSFPPTDKPLETAEGTYYFFKYDIFKHLMWYSPQKDTPVNIVAVDADHVREIQEMNANGQKPKELGSSEQVAVSEDMGYSNVVELDDLTRFDNKNNRRNGNRSRGGNNRGGNNRGGNSHRENRDQQANGANAQQNGQRRNDAPQGQERRNNDRRNNNGGNNRPFNRNNRPNNNGGNREGNNRPQQ
ncbi:MAG: regulatory iron-sulfur-containing complex subunit RicT [Bacteroidia bacterium]|nr:regulatory iron-sulfur-containing complex subunit RicT [Bacteroidia bacterium]